MSKQSNGLNDLRIYEKLFSRDFCLPSVEAWVRGESINPKGWTEENQPFLPYMITQRSDDTIHFYYNLQGVDWVQDLLISLVRRDKNFLKKTEDTVLEKIKYIRPIYEKEKTLTLPKLKKFLFELEDGYPWFEAMWWFCQMDEAKLIGLSLESLQKVRALTDKLCNSSDTVIRKSLSKIYPDLGELSSVISTSEIMSEEIPPKEELERRYRGYFFGNNKLFVDLSKKQVEKKFDVKFKVEELRITRKLIGRIAQKGIARGWVRRVMGHKQINQLKIGEIMVSPMTIPDFLPAMKKAAAIVTDEGGVVCHAAIVARELKKPCIVGTKFATQILKDGDLVEVDANKGIIRIIK
ncbi:MAG: PEP-utilizers protein [Candidatus Levybacteria bacterium]|nr:PEP-utilizers protein [Candidatus Levybacteria bacterium]